MRHIKIVKQLALGVALAGIWSPQVWAQEADAAEAESGGGAEIIVTARRVEEKLQDVPMTVNVVTDQKLKDLNLFNGSDLTAVIPGLSFAPNPGQSTPVLALRGAAKGEAGGRQDPTVQTYLNEAPVTEVMVYQSLYDIGQIEVLRGPQGTLRGRPSSAGAITFTTKRPDLTKMTSYLSLAFNNIKQTRGEAAIGVPLITDVLAVRLAGNIDRNDNDGVRSLFTNQEPYQRLSSWRASLRFKPLDFLDINLMYQDFKSVRGTLLQVKGTGYNGVSTTPPGATALPANFNGPAISAFDRLSVSDTLGIRDEKHTNFIAQVALDIGEHHRVSYVGLINNTRNVNYGGTNVAHSFPIPYPDPQLRSLDGRSRYRTHEIRMESTGSTFWDYGIGAYYEKNTSQNLVESVVSYLPGTFGRPRAALPNGFVLFPGAVNINSFNYDYNLKLIGNFPVNWKNQAIFANSTFHITPKTDLFVGARHVWYEQSSDQIGVLTDGLSATGFPTTFCGLIPATFDTNTGRQVTSAGFASTKIPGQCDVTVLGFTQFASNPIVKKENAWVYSASLTHRFTDDITAYLSFGHSWRPATNNLNLSGTRPTVLGFANTRSETSNNYEVGVKMQLLDRKLSVNLAVFQQDYKDYLLGVLGVPYVNNTDDTAGNNPALLRVATAASLATNADARVRGFDIELAYRASSQFNIAANINYARGRVKNALVPCNDSNFDGVSDGGQSTIAVSFDNGARDVNYCRSNAALSNQADWKASLQGEYNFPVSNHTDAYIRTLVSYTPKNNFAPGATTTNPFPVGGYALINLFLGMRANDGKWDIGAYARNLTNVQKELSQGVSNFANQTNLQTAFGLDLATGSGYRSTSLTPRREFGMTFRFSF